MFRKTVLGAATGVALGCGVLVIATDQYWRGPQCGSMSCTFYDRGIASEGRCGVAPSGEECYCFKTNGPRADAALDMSTPGQSQPGCLQ